jgi:hypothetical protein
MNSKHPKALSIAIAIAGITAAASVFAQDAPPTQGSAPPQEAMPPTTTAPVAQATFAQLDADSDGAVSKGEAAASAGLISAFDGLDTDGNGSLNSAEYAKFTAMPNRQMDNGTTNDADDMNGTTNDASGNGSTDGTNDDTDGNDNDTPVPETH